MKKILAIGTLLASSAAVFASPAAAYDRYDARDAARFDRDAKIRTEQRVRDQRLERERHRRELRDVRYVRSVRDRC